MILLALVVGVAIALLVLGFEMFLVLGIPALMTKEFFYGALPNAVIAQKVVGGINHSTLLAIPFFILAAELMGEGQIARRLTGFVQSLVGHRRGGMGYTVIGGSMAFGSVSGSAPATVADPAMPATDPVVTAAATAAVRLRNDRRAIRRSGFMVITGPPSGRR
jgi:C4-dicarboxylate transporter DctM subunit